MKISAFFLVFSFAGNLWARAEEAPTSLQCEPVVDQIKGVCLGADAAVAGTIESDCDAIGGEIAAFEARYQTQAADCAKTGGEVNRNGGRRARGGQAPLTADQSQLLEESRALLDKCAQKMGEIASGFADLSQRIEERRKSAKGSANCRPKAQEFYMLLKLRADQGAAQSKAKTGEYGGAGRSVEAKRDQTKNNADGMGGDQKKAAENSGAGSGFPDPSSLMKAMAEKKAQQDAEDAKKAAEEKARLEKEKALRIQKCQNNEINRNNAISKCKADFPVDTRYTTVATVKKDQEDCIANAGILHGPIVLNCAAIP